VPCTAGQGFVGTAWHAGGMRTAYRCRAYPDAAQQAVLNRTFGCVRLVWNTILAARQERYATMRQGTSYGQASAALTAMKQDPQRAWLNDVSCVPLQQALRHQQQAFAAFFARRARYPRFKSRAGRQAAEYTRSAFTLRDGVLHLAKTPGPLAFAWSWPDKVRDARADFLHKITTHLVRGYDLIAIEDLAVKNMVGNRRLARAISDCGWGEFRRQLEYKCQRAGRRLIVIDRWYPSTKTCSACGFVLADLPLQVRTWRCPSCRTRHDRDLNAAKNILAAGLAAARDFPGDACGADVRHREIPPVRSAVKQEPQLARAGIPVLQGGE
jgi:IS605 OrfB family transposase